MSKLTKKYFKERLYVEKKKLLNILEKMKNIEEFGAMDEYYTELSFYDNHPADLGTEVFMMEQDKGLIDKLNNTLYEIEKSIEALDKDNFGLCEACRKRIDEERLELIPYVKLCVDCANKKIPLDKKRQFRPEEEDSISPFSKSRSEGNALDREDSYQEVARYNRIDSDPSFTTGDDMGVYDEENSGVVEEVEKISQEYYDETNE
ncbi:Transcriptional regulator, TraR/DksA family [[Clostridium] ultunense Esp]|uniref:Transcriptional regulator, TraR/DksA family n=1 Tax=[Clostridium] ultunense Esp TaxID=1288971 RepID=M1ZDN5_9FIRM|nr:TraR/DksA C4-type zinc finger protein [Schnuerera ultunensis]CCQ96043.1 Transcriptional regulator, TraR/DksA family [[Clostridium] ultunense Esp]SHD76937.1 Transcriptional regulator, TraR/DksA family [[Clostridium] ultunense Esp]